MLTPKDQPRLERLHLLAQHVVEGVLAGQHRSHHKGASVEFKEHRQYVRGDEIRSIDWKLFGKTDRTLSDEEINERLRYDAARQHVEN